MSVLRDVSPAARAALLEHASEATLERGERILPNDGPNHVTDPRSCSLIVGGLVRTFSHSGSRQVTMQYQSTGQLIGLAPSIRRVPTKGIGAQALTDTRVLCLPPAVFAHLAETDVTVGKAVIDHLVEIMIHNVSQLSDNVMSPLRSRICHHLLDLAERDEGRFVVRARVQDIADAVGSTREVVTAVLRRLRADGLVTREDRLLVLPDPARLHSIGSGEE